MGMQALLFPWGESTDILQHVYANRVSFNFFTAQCAASKLGDRLKVWLGTRGETRRQRKKYLGKGRKAPLIPLINTILSNGSVLLLVYHVPSWTWPSQCLMNQRLWLWEEACSRLKEKLKLIIKKDNTIFKCFPPHMCEKNTRTLYLNSHFWPDGYNCWNLLYKSILCECYWRERHRVSVVTASEQRQPWQLK